MPEPVRVKDNTTGHEYSTYGVYEGLTVLDEPAVDAYGELLPPTYPEAAPAVATEAAAPSEPAATAEVATPAAATSKPTTGPKATTKES